MGSVLQASSFTCVGQLPILSLHTVLPVQNQTPATAPVAPASEGLPDWAPRNHLQDLDLVDICYAVRLFLPVANSANVKPETTLRYFLPESTV